MGRANARRALHNQEFDRMIRADLRPPPPGFKKVDLHVHTCFSACYVDHMQPEKGRKTSPEEILQAALAALEITDPRKQEKWNTGSDVRYKLPRAVIQSSDAHAPEEIGRRPIFLKLNGDATLSSIRNALADFRASIVFPAARTADPA